MEVSKQNIVSPAVAILDAPRSATCAQAQTSGHTSANGGPHDLGVDDLAYPCETVITECAGNTVYPDFQYIRHICENDKLRPVFSLAPCTFAEHRRANWPSPDFGSSRIELVNIYNAVRATGVPNLMAARIPVPNELNVDAWVGNLKGIDEPLLDMIVYGFPMGYIGPVSPTQYVDNHPSALQFPEHVAEFIDKELGFGGLMGPLAHPPFTQWCHVSPLMTRPKSDSDSRRIITDLTFPHDSSVNAYIRKHTVMGRDNTHCLPSIDSVVARLQDQGPGAYMFTLDVARSCPLDWPLLAMRWDSEYYLDVTLPFGARASSAHMQRVAQAIVHMLAKKGIVAFMYLDDMIVVSPDEPTACTQYKQARALLDELGLPEAISKAQPPAPSVKWLGIQIDAAAGTLSVPNDKIQQVIQYAEKHMSKRSISRKDLQSVLGRLLYIAKCIRPARLFVSRLLEQLRGAKRQHINIDSSMRADLEWFRDFAMSWNGVAVFPDSTPTRDIVVDACLTGIGAATVRTAYALQVAPMDRPYANINELEALNVAVALQTFAAESDRGKRITVYCDNKAAVSVLQSGRGQNKAILEVARAAWMIQALFQVSIEYKHIPGHLNDLADALSRAHASKLNANRAHELMIQNQLTRIHPCMYAFELISHLLSHRPPNAAAGGRCHPTTGGGPGSRDKRQQAGSGPRLPNLLLPPALGPARSGTIPDLHICGTAQQPESRPAHDTEPHHSPKNVFPPRWRPTSVRSLQGDQSSRGHTQKEGLCEKGQTSRPSGGDSQGFAKPAPHTRQTGDRYRDTLHVLWCPQAVGGRSPINEGLRPPESSNEGRRKSDVLRSDHQNKSSQEHAKIRSEGVGPVVPSTQVGDVPCKDDVAHNLPVTYRVRNSTNVHLQQDWETDTRLPREVPVEGGAREGWNPHRLIHPALPAEGCSISRVPGGLQ